MSKNGFQVALKQASEAAGHLAAKRQDLIAAAESFEQGLSAWEEKAKTLADAMDEWDPCEEDPDEVLAPLQEAADEAWGILGPSGDDLDACQEAFEAARQRAMAALQAAEVHYNMVEIPT